MRGVCPGSTRRTQQPCTAAEAHYFSWQKAEAGQSLDADATHTHARSAIPYCRVADAKRIGGQDARNWQSISCRAHRSCSLTPDPRAPSPSSPRMGISSRMYRSEQPCTMPGQRSHPGEGRGIAAKPRGAVCGLHATYVGIAFSPTACAGCGNQCLETPTKKSPYSSDVSWIPGLC